MGKTVRKLPSLALSVLLVLTLVFVEQNVYQKKVFAAVTVSRIVQNLSGKGYLEVDGKPYLYLGVQNCGKQQILGNQNPFQTPMPVSWLENCFEKTKAAGYKTIAIILKWNDIEPTTQGVFDWSLVDNYVDWANKYGLRIDLVWFGSNGCGGTRLPGYTNGWICQVPGYVQSRTQYFGYATLSSGIFCPYLTGTDATNLKNWEVNAVINLFNHLASYDTNHRVIFFQVENEPNYHPGWNSSDYNNVLNWLNAIGGAVKNSNYVVATRVNMMGQQADANVGKLSNIDCVGPDPYVSSVGTIASIINDTSKSKMTYIAENDGSYGNLPSLVLTAIVNGGFYDSWQLNDHWWDQGIYDAVQVSYVNWTLGTIPSLRSGAGALKNLLLGMNGAGSLIAQSSQSKMAGYNIDGDWPATGHSATKNVCGYNITYACTDASVGLAVVDSSYVYCMSSTGASNTVTFKINQQPVGVTEGYLDDNNNWVTQNTRSYTSNGDGTYSVTYNFQTCLRIQLPVPSNLALMATASATSCQSGTTAAMAIDNNVITGWGSANATYPQYLTLNWSSGQTFNTVNLKCTYCQGQAVTNFDVEVSADGSTNWTNVVNSGSLSYSTNNMTVETKTVIFNTQTNMKGLRIKVNTANNQWGHCAVTELEVNNNGGPTPTSTPTPTPTPTPTLSNLALTATASATTCYPGTTAALAIDSNVANGWGSAVGAGYPQYLTLNWSSGQTFNTVNLKCAYCLGQAVTHFDVEVSADGSTNWTNVANSGSLSYSTNDTTVETKTVTFTGQTNKKGLRIKINSANNQWGHCAVTELEVYNN